MSPRALAGTREWAVPCGTCGHARGLHEKRGRGRCVRLTIEHRETAEGDVIRTPARCHCPRHTTDQRIL